MMKKRNSLILIAIVSILFAQCTAKKTASNKMTDEEIVAAVKKQYTAAQMDEGKSIFQSNCGKCHALFEPETRTISKWERVLPRMNSRAKLDDTQAGKVRAYLIANAKSS